MSIFDRLHVKRQYNGAEGSYLFAVSSPVHDLLMIQEGSELYK